MADIESEMELRSYLEQRQTTSGLTGAEINAMVRSAIFENRKFQGMFAKPLLDKFSRDERREFLAALGDPPRVVADCYPVDGTRCEPLPNYWCAHYDR
jgi:hypothetical protein